MKKYLRRISICLLILFSIQILTNIKIDKITFSEANASEVEDVSKPTTPSNLRSIFIATDRATLIWDKSYDDVGVTGYDIFMGDKLIASSPKESFQITGLEANTEYNFKVRAKDASGRISDFSNSIKIVTSASESKNTTEEIKPEIKLDENDILGTNKSKDSNEININVPNTPKNLLSPSQTETSITLTWECDAGDHDITKYNIYNGNTKIGTTDGEKNYVISNLIPGTSYNLSVTAVDSLGNVSLSSEVLTVKTKEDKESPTKPTKLKVESKNETSANIIWSEGSDNIGVYGYEIYSGDVKIGTVEGISSYNITQLTPNTTYYYTVKTKDLAGNLSENSDVIEVTTDKDMDPPSIPTGLKVVSNNEEEVTINWNESKDVSKVSYYEIYSDSDKIGTVSNGTSFTLKELIGGKVYNFTVKAVDDSGNKSIESATLVFNNVVLPLERINRGVTTNQEIETTTQVNNSLLTARNSESIQKATVPTQTYNWTSETIGNAWPIGNYSGSNGTYTLQSRGWDIGGVDDACQYAYTSKNGDYSITTRVNSIDNPNLQYKPDSAAKAGLMIRNTSDTGIVLDENGRNIKDRGVSNVFIGITSSNSIVLTYRNGLNQYTYKEADIVGTAPIYLKLTRLGKTITGYQSSDGVNWIQVGSPITIDDLKDNIFMGMAVTANCNEHNLATGTFENTSIEGSDILKPSIPTLTGGILNPDGSITLSWTEAKDNVLVSGYKIYRNGAEIADIKDNSLSYKDSSVDGNNNAYTYTVRAYDRSGNISDDSNKQICGIDKSIPGTPINVYASSIDGGNITLKWTIPQNSASIVAYDIFNAEDKRIGTTTVDSITISDLTANTSYSFYVKARNISNIYSEKSNVVVASTTGDDYGNSIGKAYEIKTENKIQGSFEYTGDKDLFKVTPNRTGEYTLKSYGEGNININLMDSAGNSLITGNLCNSEMKITLSKDQIYYLKVYSYYSYGNYEFSINEVINEVVKAPELKLESKTASTVDISWNGKSSIDHYDIYRNSKKIATINGDLTSFKDTMLNGNTQYEYRIIAFDKLGNTTSASNEVVVTTETNNKIPTAPTSINLLSKTSESITISWNIPEGNGEDVYYLIYNNEIQVGKSYTNTFTLTNLLADSVQNIRIMSINSTGLTSQLSDKISATTYKDDYGNKIENATQVTAGKSYTGALEYTGDSDFFKFTPTVSGVFYFNSKIRPVLYDGSGNKLIENKFITLNKDITYYFEVKSSTLNAYSFVITLSRPSTLEVAPIIYQSKVSGSAITINWDSYQNTLGIDKYYIYRNGSQIAEVGSDVLNFTDDNLTSNTSYSYYIVGKDVVGTLLKKSNVINVSTAIEKIVPTTPSNLQISLGVTTAIITWTQATDASGIKCYEIYRDGLIIGQATSNSFEDKHLIPGTSYVYKIRAIDTLNNSSAFSEDKTITIAADTLPPSIPTDLKTSNITSGSVTLSWKQPLDNGEITSYLIYKDGEKVGESSNNVFIIKGLTINTKYKFNVVAKDSAGNISPLSDDCLITTLDDDYGDEIASATEISVGKNISRINNYTDDYDLFKFKVSTSGKYKIELPYSYMNNYLSLYDEKNNEINISSDTFELMEGVVYYLSVSSYVTNFRIMPIIKTELPPTIPTGLKVTNTDVTKITLNWNPSTDLVAVDYYQIYRNGILVGKVDSNKLTYTDSKLAPGTNYTYEVKAYNVYGISSGVMESVKVRTKDDIELPTSPTDVSLINITGWDAMVKWAASTDDGEIKEYEILLNGVCVGTTTNTEFNINNLQQNTEYKVTIRSKDTSEKYSGLSSELIIKTYEDDYKNSQKDATEIRIGKDVLGTNNYNGDLDFFKFNTPLTGIYTINFGNKYYMLKVYDDKGNLLFNNYSNRNISSKLSLEGGRTYYISTERGNYSYKITVEEKELPITPKVLTQNSTASTATITWEASKDNVGIDYYIIKRNGQQISTVKDNVFSFTDTSLRSNTEYVYSVLAVDVSGNISTGNMNYTVKTQIDVENPSIPSNLIVQKVTGWQVTVKWDASTDNGVIDSYEIYNGDTLVGKTQDTIYTVTGLQPLNSYKIKVKAKDSGNNYSDLSSELIVNTYEDDYKDSQKDATEIRIGKDILSTKNYNGDLDFFKFNTPLTGNYTINFGTQYYFLKLYDDKGNLLFNDYSFRNISSKLSLEGGRTYYISTEIGNGSFKITVEEKEIPTAPKVLTQNSTASTATISWEAANDNVGIDYYIIKRNGQQISTVKDNVFSFTDTSLRSNTEYVYSVFAVDVSGNISIGNMSYTLKTQIDGENPSVPNNLMVQEVTGWQVTIKWDASTDDGVLDGYEIYNGDTLVGKTKETTYIVTGLKPLNSYRIKVRANDSGNNYSIFSNELIVKTYEDDYKNSLQDATEIRIGKDILSTKNYNGDLDFFKFNTPLTGNYTINFGTKYYFLKLYDDKGNLLFNDYSFRNISSKLSLEGGRTYYISTEGGNSSFKITVEEKELPIMPKVLNYESTISSATISWVAASDNVGIDYYIIKRNGQEIARVNDNIFSFTDIKLRSDTEYAYSVSAVDVSGNISIDMSYTVKTQIDRQAPTVPKNLIIQKVTGWQVVIKWDASTDDGVLDGYEIYNGDTLVGKTEVTTYTVTGLQPLNSYEIKVKAKDSGNNYSNFALINVKTRADEYGDDCNCASTILVGRVISGNITYSDIDFFKFTAPIDGKYSLKHIDDKIFSLTVYDEDGKRILYNEWNDTKGASFDLIGGKTYYVSTNSYGDYSFRINVAETDAPSKVAVSNNSDKTTIVTTTISWTVANDNVGIDYYEIYRDGIKIAKVNYDILTFVDKGLKAYTNHTYYVKAIDVSGNTSTSDSIDIRTLWDSEDPGAPTNLKVVAKTAWKVTLSWDASTDDGAVESYEIFDGSKKVGETEGLSYTITGLNQNTTYNFTVKAKDTAGKYSVLSKILSVTTYLDDYKNTINEASEIRIGKVLDGNRNYYDDLDCFTFVAPINGEYKFESVGNNHLYCTLFDWNNNPYDRTFIGNGNYYHPMVLTLEQGKKYTLQLCAYYIGSYGLKVSVAETEKPYEAPSNGQKVSTTASTITLSWSAGKDNVGIDYYEIYRNGTRVGKVNDSVLSFTDTKLISLTEYNYYIVAVDVNGNISDQSTKVTIKTAEDLIKPLAPSYISVNSRTSSSILLSWADAIDNDGVIQKYEIYNGTQKLGDPVTNSFEVKNLNYNTSYTFTIKAIDTGNNVSDGRDITVSTYGDDYGNDTNHASEVELVKEIKGKLDYIGDIDYFTFEGKITGAYKIKALSSMGVYAELWTASGLMIASSDLSNSEIDINLNKGDKYYIKTYKVNNLIQYGFIIECEDNEKPTITGDLLLEEKTISSIKISWGASTDNVRVKEYMIYRDNYEIGRVDGNVLSFIDRTFVGGESHEYYVRAIDPNNNYSEESARLTVIALKDTEGPAKPTGLKVANKDNNTVSLIWTKSNDNKAVASYKVYVNGIYNNDMTTTESITIAGLVPNTEYSFTIKAFDADGNVSEMSDEFKVITPWILESNGLVEGDLTIKEGCFVNLNGYELRITGNLYYNGGSLLIRTGQLVVLGNITINDTNLDLETGIIEVGNSVYQRGGTLNINRGNLLIKGNFIISNGKKSSRLIMNQQDAYVLVEGDFETSSDCNHLGNLTNGVIEIKGDFRRIQGARCNFAASDNHIVVLSGSSVQRVTYPVNFYSMNILVLSKPYETGYVFSTVPCWQYIVDNYAIDNTFGISDGQGVYGPTGNYCKQFTDLKVNNNGKDFVFVRTYNSLDKKEDKGFGKGWTFNYEARITDLGGDTNTVIASLPDGSSQSFKKNNDGSYTALNSRNILEKNGSGLYILTTKDQTKFEFNISGYLVKITDKYGNLTTINVTDKGKVTEIVDAVGRCYRITYDSSNNLISSITDPNGYVTTYSYSGNKLVKVTDPLNNSTTYEYYDNGLLKTIKDANNHQSQQMTYNTYKGVDENKVSTIIDEYGNKQTYKYNKSTMITTITDSNGRTTEQAFNSTYNLISTTDAEGKKATTTYFIDSDNRSKFGEVQSTKDRNGNTTSYERDGRGNITKITNADGSFKSMEYDDKNNLIKETNVDGKYTYYIYDSNKVFLLNKIQPLNGTDVYSTSEIQSKFAITTYEYYADGTAGVCNVKGLLKSVKDPNGNTTTYTYDKYGNVYSTTDAENKTAKCEYDADGLKIKVTSAGNNIIVYNYDKKGNVIRIITNGVETTRKVYDSLGRLIKEVSPNQYKASDDISDSIYNGDYGKRYTYYDNGKVKTVTDAENYTITYEYDLYGNILTETKPNGSIYRYEYDKMNRVVNTYFKANSSAKEILLESHKYEILNNGNTQKTDSKYFDENKTKYSEIITQYDYAGRVINIRNSDGLAVVTVYNANGTISSNTDTSGNTTYYEYDGLNRLSEQWTPIERINNIIYYTYNKVEYDNVGNKIKESYSREKVLKGIRPTGQITITYVYYKNNKVKSQSISSGSEKQYEYDNDGNLIKETTKIDSKIYSIREYEYNKLNKVIKESYKVLAGDLSKNSYNDTSSVIILTQNEYDKEGNLTKNIAADNSTTQYVYDKLGRIISCKKSNNGVIVTANKTYNWEGKVLTETDGNGNITTYTYDERGFLIKVTDAKGNNALSFYDIAGRKIAEVAPNDYSETKQLSEMNRTEYVYDNMSRIIEKKVIYLDVATNTWKTISVQKLEYDNSSNVIKETEADGSYVTKTYNLTNNVETICDGDGNKRGLKYSVKYIYNGNGDLISEIDANGTYKIYTYDEVGNVISTSVKGKEETIATVIGSSTYNLVNQQLTSTDGNGVITTYEYNEFGKIRKVTYAGDSTIEAYYIIHQYDELGRLTKKTDSRGVIEVYTYDSFGRELAHTQSKADGTEAITTAATYDNNGNKTSTTDGNGNVTEYIYNEVNQLTSKIVYVTNSNNTKVKQETKYTYDKNGNLLTETNYLGNTITNIYDALNRVIEKKNEYSITIQKLEYNDNGTQSKSTDALGNITTFEYDNNKRLLKTTDPTGAVTQKTYDAVGNIATATDGNGNIVKYYYDKTNKLTKVETNNNGIQESTSYTYDLNGNMLTQKDGAGNVTSFVYNVANKVSKKIYPAGTSKEVSYTYYGNGLEKESVDRNGIKTTSVYDIHGRLISQKTGDLEITYTYDNNGNVLTIIDATGTTTRTYDELNSVISKTVPVIGKSIYNYDVITGITGLTAGNYGEITTDPKGNKVIKIYDKAKRLVEVRDGNNKTTYTYYDNGSLKEVTLPNYFKESYEYYSDNKLKTLVNKDASGNVIEKYTYTYDKAKNLLSKVDPKGTTAYTYDSMNRLWTVTEPGQKTTTYTYDGAGNRDKEVIVKNGITTINQYTYDGSNRLLKIKEEIAGVLAQDTDYTYDNNGNQLTSTVTNYQGTNITKSTTSYRYDALNQMIGTTTSAGLEITYGYNGEGLRVLKASNGKTVRYLYEGDKVILEVDGNGVEKARSVNGTNQISRTIGGEVLYYLYNGHADVTQLTNTLGKTVATYYYDAFGVIIDSSGSADNPIRYAGYQYDEETGLYYLNARMYDPTIARFLQEDTYTGDKNDPLSLNRYAYCNNEPIMHTDPSGHFWSELWSGVKEVASAVWEGVKSEASREWNDVKEIYNSIDDAMENSDDNYDALNKDLEIDNPIVRRVEGIFNGFGKFGWGVIKSSLFVGKTVIDSLAADTATRLNAWGVTSDETANHFNTELKGDFDKWKEVPGAILDMPKNIWNNAPRFFTDPNMTVGEVSNLTNDVLNTALLVDGGIKTTNKVKLKFNDIATKKFTPKDLNGAVEESSKTGIRERVSNNIEESKTAREASNYNQFAQFEKTFKGAGNPQKTLLTGEDWNSYFKEAYGANNVQWESAVNSMEDIIDTPSLITRLNPNQLSDLANKSSNLSSDINWNCGPLKIGRNKGIPYENGGGISINKNVNGNVVGDYIQYHPGSSHHGEIPYYKVSSAPNGEVKFYYDNGIWNYERITPRQSRKIR